MRSVGGVIGTNTRQAGFIHIEADDPLPSGDFDLITIGLEGSRVRDEDLVRIDELPQLTTLNLSWTDVGDEGLARLGSLPSLRNLYLVRTKITDAGLRELERYPSLGAMHLDDNSVTDAGVASVAAWPGLTHLHLSNTAITDAGVPALGSLKHLTELHVRVTALTRDGVSRQQQALPRCRIRSNFGEFGPGAPVSPDQTPDLAVAEWAHSIGGTVGRGESVDAAISRFGPMVPSPGERLELRHLHRPPRGCGV